MRHIEKKCTILETLLFLALAVSLLLNAILAYVYETEKRVHLEIERELICRIDKEAK